MATEENKQGRRQVVRGVVVSDKMTKTRIIEIKRTQDHRLYHKKLIHQKRLFIHDEKNESRLGDVVMAESTRPLSRHKNFRLIKIVEKRVAE